MKDMKQLLLFSFSYTEVVFFSIAHRTHPFIVRTIPYTIIYYIHPLSPHLNIPAIRLDKDPLFRLFKVVR